MAQVGYAHRLQGPFDMVKGFSQMRGEGVAGFGQRQALRRANEQGYTEIVFELLDLTADRALGDVQSQSRLAETAMPRDFFKDSQHVERGQLTHERMTPHLTPTLGSVGQVYCFFGVTVL